MTTQRKRPKREVDTVDFLRMLGRMMKAASVRVAQSDEDEFAQLAKLDQVLQLTMDDAVRGLRASGLTWQQIGDAAGTTRQAAHQRWARKCGELDGNTSRPATS